MSLDSSFDATARPEASSGGLTIRFPDDNRVRLFRNALFAFLKLNEASVALELEFTVIGITT
jgi:hypothetical protein